MKGLQIELIFFHVFYYFVVDIEDEEDNTLKSCENELWYDNDKLNDVLIFMEKQKNDVYPQGFDYCKKLVEKQRDNCGRIHILASQTSPKTYYYYY